VKYVLIGLLKVWRLAISPLYGDVCRYYPSCSAYALRAVQYHGAIRGSWLTVRRLLRCHPWAAGGYDPVRGTPEFDEEMRDQAARAATMEEGPVGDPIRDAPSGRQTPDRLSHQHTKHTMQGRAVTVAQGRGVK
jgi:putative membrane protein insertion efficiency factor